jgi:hypothetical protein
VAKSLYLLKALKMVLERTDTEIVIRLPKGIDWGDLESILKYIRYREIVSKSEATQEDIDQIATEMNTSWWAENQHRFLKS